MLLDARGRSPPRYGVRGRRLAEGRDGETSRRGRCKPLGTCSPKLVGFPIYVRVSGVSCLHSIKGLGPRELPGL